MKPPSYRAPRTDRAKRPMDGFADEWVPRYISEELERERNELLEALEGLLENYKYNQGQGLGIGPITKAKTAIAKAKGKTP